MIGIYKITSPLGKIYIGQSIDIDYRFYVYKKLKCKQQLRIYNSFLKHGVDNHVFEVIEECNVEFLNERERYWQDYYNVLGKKGLNCILVSTNECSKVLSKETKSKISNSLFGFKHTEESKGKINLFLSSIIGLYLFIISKPLFGIFIDSWLPVFLMVKFILAPSKCLHFICNKSETRIPPA